ncbi:hypothetical protein ABZW49_40480 [Nonomuraea wenchangensis]
MTLGPSSAADLVVGSGNAYVSAEDRIIVTNTSGTVTGTVTGLSGVSGLALAAHDTRLYAALRGSNEVAEIDTSDLTIIRRMSLSTYPCPSTLAVSGTRLWVGHGCGNSWQGGVVGLDLTAETPTPATFGRRHYAAPALAAAGDTLVVGETAIGPADLLVYDISGAAPSLKGEIDGHTWYLDNLHEIALTSDGSSALTAGGAPYHFARYDTTTLSRTSVYGDQSLDGYPASVAISASDSYIAGGRRSGTDLTVYDATTGSIVLSADNSAGDLVAGSIAFSGADVYALVLSSANRLHLWRLTGVALPASTLTMKAPSQVLTGAPVIVHGQLTLADGTAPGVQPLTVTRHLPDGTSTRLEDVTTTADGAFTFADTSPGVGPVTYTVLWDGDARARGSSTSITVTIKYRSSLTLTGPRRGITGKAVRLRGMLVVGGQQPTPGATLKVWRSVTAGDDTASTTPLPAVAVSDDGSYRFTDTPATAGTYAYIVQWPGDATAGGAKALHRVIVKTHGG